MKIQQFDFSVNLLQSIIWQYNESSNLLSLLNSKQSWYNLNQSQFWSSWYTNVFNLLTANAFGISVWSYILNVPLYIDNPVEPSNKPLWGFNQIISYPTLENTYLNFGNGNFSTRGQIINLTLEEQRFLLRLRYFQLYTRGNVEVNAPQAPNAPISGINNFLNYLVSTSNIGYTGEIYVDDNLDMTMSYIFTDTNFPKTLLKVITALDIWPRPAGVNLIF